MKPGAMCVNLIEVLSGSLAGKHHATPKTKYQMLENQGVFLDMLRSKGIRLVNIGNEDLVEGNRTLILGLTWTLILRYEIQKYGADENELLRWVRACTKGYKEVKITSWGDSFNDGLAFCALIHKHAPEELDYPGLDKGAKLTNLKKAFDVAEAIWSVPQLLDPADLAGEQPTDDRSVITYVARLRQAFSDKELEMRRRLAAEEEERLHAERLAAAKRANEGRAALEAEAAELAKWTKEKEGKFAKDAAASSPSEKKKALGGTPDETRALLSALRDGFRGKEKPPKAKAKARLADEYAKLSAAIAKHAAEAETLTPEQRAKLPTVTAVSAAAAPEALQKLWGGMEGAEGEYEAALLARLAALDAEKRAKETDALLGPLEAAAKELLGWTAAKTDGFVKGALPENLGGGKEETAAKKAALKEFHDGEKPPKQLTKVELQEGLREVAQRLAQEGRDPPPVRARRPAASARPAAPAPHPAAPTTPLFTPEARGASLLPSHHHPPPTCPLATSHPASPHTRSPSATKSKRNGPRWKRPPPPSTAPSTTARGSTRGRRRATRRTRRRRRTRRALRSGSLPSTGRPRRSIRPSPTMRSARRPPRLSHCSTRCAATSRGVRSPRGRGRRRHSRRDGATSRAAAWPRSGRRRSGSRRPRRCRSRGRGWAMPRARMSRRCSSGLVSCRQTRRSGCGRRRFATPRSPPSESCCRL